MLSIAKSHLYRPRIKSIETFLNEVENLTVSNLMEVANEVFDEKALSMLIFEGKDND